ncbi:cytochrome P450 2D18 [Colletotrichum navitas]|uniref:Cytochrome P450 2D18 n=1 Tax=Colletotrichum navitas TaxID=681940 RepID=A0AAD8PPU2_9PEZI|nr:cytochrome P450 2D18 [Colletotrichum navitas]KAK1573711.1 cytochrome P450 2D18 [Colletotrichum navitas]
MGLTVITWPFTVSYYSLFWTIPAILLLYKVLTFGSREKHLPPGPPTIPILGNAHLIPPAGFFSKLKEWGDQYGPMFSIKVGKSTMIVLNDRRAVHELLVSKGAHFNNRPSDEQFRLALRDENIALMKETAKWREQRKITAQFFSPKNLDTSLKGVQEAEVATLMYDLLNKPEEFTQSIKRTTASIASITLFGNRATDWGSFWAYAVYIAMEAVSKALEPGSYLPVDQFPILKLIPVSWMESRNRANECYKTVAGVWKEAYERVKERREAGDKRVSLLDSVLEGEIEMGVPHASTAMNNFFGAVHQGAADTTATATLTSILLLAKYPQFQERARVELDRVCGFERTPKWSDFKDLPYINCIVKEGLRIRPVVPSGVPHVAAKDQIYDGMLIPAGSAVFIPAYGLNYHPDSFSEPEVYNPDRYLAVAHKLAPELAASPNYSERDHYSYGAGRRLCVGVHMAERTQWRLIAQILWAFRIERAIGDDGTVIEPDTSYAAYDDGFLSSPKEYRVRFVPRSEKHAEVVRREFSEIEGFLKQYE